MTEFKANFIAVLAPAIWAITPLLVKFMPDMNPFLIIAIAFQVFVTIEFSRQIIFHKIVSFKQVPIGFFLNGTAGLFVFHFGYLYAIKTAPLVPVFLIINLINILIYLYAFLFFKLPITSRHILAMVLSFGGIIFLALARGAMYFEVNDIYGYLAAFAAANAWAIYSVLSRKFANVPQEAIVYNALLTCLFGFGLLYFTGQTLVISASHYIPYLLIMGLLPFGYAFYLWNYGMQKGDIRIISVLSYINPILASSLVIYFGFADFYWQMIPAFLLVVAGSILVVYPPKKNKRRK